VVVTQAVVQVKEDVALLTKELLLEPSSLSNFEGEQPAVSTEMCDVELRSSKRAHRSAGSTDKQAIWWISGAALSTAAAIVGREWRFFGRVTLDAGLCGFSFVSLVLLLATHSAVIKEVGLKNSRGGFQVSSAQSVKLRRRSKILNMLFL
jgi:hypothetical protein